VNGEIKALAEEIYQMTAGLKLTGQPDNAETEIDSFSELTDKRGPLVDRLTDYLKQSGNDKNERREIERIVKDITELDKEHFMIMEHIKKSVMTAINDARNGRKLNSAYAPFAENEQTGLLDAKQ